VNPNPTQVSLKSAEFWICKKLSEFDNIRIRIQSQTLISETNTTQIIEPKIITYTSVHLNDSYSNYTINLTNKRQHFCSLAFSASAIMQY